MIETKHSVRMDASEYTGPITADGRRWYITIPKDMQLACCIMIGDQPGSIVLDGVGSGNVYREGSGSGHAIRAGLGHGKAVRVGTGNGSAARLGSGDGDAYCATAGVGNAVRLGRGFGSAIRDGFGNGNAIYKGFRGGGARRTGSGRGIAKLNGKILDFQGPLTSELVDGNPFAPDYRVLRDLLSFEKQFNPDLLLVFLLAGGGMMVGFAVFNIRLECLSCTIEKATTRYVKGQKCSEEEHVLEILDCFGDKTILARWTRRNDTSDTPPSPALAKVLEVFELTDWYPGEIT